MTERLIERSLRILGARGSARGWVGSCRWRASGLPRPEQADGAARRGCRLAPSGRAGRTQVALREDDASADALADLGPTGGEAGIVGVGRAQRLAQACAVLGD